MLWLLGVQCCLYCLKHLNRRWWSRLRGDRHRCWRGENRAIEWRCRVRIEITRVHHPVLAVSMMLHPTHRMSLSRSCRRIRRMKWFITWMSLIHQVIFCQLIMFSAFSRELHDSLIFFRASHLIFICNKQSR